MKSSQQSTVLPFQVSNLLTWIFLHGINFVLASVERSIFVNAVFLCTTQGPQRVNSVDLRRPTRLDNHKTFFNFSFLSIDRRSQILFHLVCVANSERSFPWKENSTLYGIEANPNRMKF